MPDYSNGKNVLLRRPEPGRPTSPPPKENIRIDTNAIAEAVIKAIVAKMPSGEITVAKNNDSFDTINSLKRLADTMSNTVQDNKNLEGVGQIHEVKRDKETIDKSIDILSKLGD